MPRIETALTKLLRIRVPVVLPPMAGASGGALAAAVSKGGGFGFVAAGASPVSHLRSQLDIARECLSLKPTEPLPVGIGLMVWKVEAPHGDPSTAPAFLETIIEAKPAAIWLSFGVDIAGWVEKIRKVEKEKGGGRTPIFVMVGSVKKAVEAAKWDIDVLVAQGIDSGGHGPTYQSGLPLHSLLPSIKLAFSSLPHSPILLGAGGIATGSQLVASLPYSSGVVIGTSFLPSPESLYSKAQRDFVLKSDGGDTVRSMNFDHSRGSLGWGDGVDGRGLKNLTTEMSEKEAGSEETKKAYTVATKEGDLSRIVTWSGTSVGLVQEALGAEELVKRIEKEALESLNDILALKVE